MNTLRYPLHLVGWQGSQVIAHAKALLGTVNTASLNLAAVQGGPVCLKYDSLQLNSLEEAITCRWQGAVVQYGINTIAVTVTM